jgi:hypothetical protein
MTIASPEIDFQRLSLKDIRAIADIEMLQDVLDRLDTSIELITAQLEFGAENETVDWEKRATEALGIKRAQVRVALRHMEQLKRAEAKPKVVAVANPEAARAKAEASRQNSLDNLEASRLATERARLKYERLARVDTHFRQFAKKYLTTDQLLECERGAEAAALVQVERAKAMGVAA